MCFVLLRKCLHLDLRFCALAVVLFSLVTFICFLVRLAGAPSAFNDASPPSLSPANSTGPGLLLVLIHASGKGAVVRDAIRKTWVSPALLELEEDLRHRISYRFVLGVKGIPNDLRVNLTAESQTHRDMILLEDVSDQHESLAYRTLRSFQHVVANERDFLYLLKCDDDSFVNLLAMGRELSQRTSHRAFYWGHFLGAGGVTKEGPYAEHRWSICETYLPYALGGGYVVSMDLVRLVALSAPYLNVYRNEDVSLGAWLAPYNLDVVFDSRFNTAAVIKGCKKVYMVMHRVSVEQMHAYFEGVMEEGHICTKKNFKFVWYGYRYNWKAQPSKCCNIRKRYP